MSILPCKEDLQRRSAQQYAGGLIQPVATEIEPITADNVNGTSSLPHLIGT